MKTKAIALLLGAAMMASVLAGCSNGKESSETEGEKTNEDTSEETEESAETEESKDTDVEKPFEGVVLTLESGNMELEGVKAVAALAQETLGLTIEIGDVAIGAEVDNLIRTKLAAGEQTDLLLYNCGPLFYGLNPEEYFMDISDQEFIQNIDETFINNVTVDGKVYGIPKGNAEVGAILYNKAIYRELGLEVPKTWDEFLANCATIKEAGKTAVIASCGDTWTAQLIFYGDNYNALKKVPDFPEQFDAGKAKFADTPAFIDSLEKYGDLIEYYNADYAVATYNDAIDMLATGEGTHYPMLSSALNAVAELYPEVMDDIGVFAIPGDDPENVGLTTWLPHGLYASKNTENPEAVLAFMELWLSSEGQDAYYAAQPPVGPSLVKGYEMPDDVYVAVQEMMEYVNEGKTIPNLTELTQVKGLEIPAICAEITIGSISAEEAAAAFDEDCKKQAIQMGLDW